MPAITTHDHMVGHELYPASHAIILYENQQSHQGYATVHPLRAPIGAGPPEILPGRPLDREFVLRLARGLQASHTRFTLIPSHLLYLDPARMLWWKPACRRLIFFKSGDPDLDTGVSEKVVAHPPLLFLAEHRSLYVYALGESARPTENTPLFRAPYFNISSDGLLCFGNVVFPREAEPDRLQAWEDAFFNSSFTHNAYQGVPITQHPKQHKGLWQEMLTAKGFRLAT